MRLSDYVSCRHPNVLSSQASRLPLQYQPDTLPDTSIHKTRELTFNDCSVKLTLRLATNPPNDAGWCACAAVEEGIILIF